MGKKRVIVSAVWISAIFCVIFLPGFSRLQKLREENEQLLKRISFLEESNSKLEEDTKRMSKPAYLEKRAREKLGVIKKDEYIYKEQPPNSAHPNKKKPKQ